MSTNVDTKKNYKKYVMPTAVLIGAVTVSSTCYAADAASGLDIISKFLKEMTNIMKNEGKLALETASFGAGGWFGAKAGTWVPVIGGAVGAGLIELGFRIIG
jgi:hypothetical protein